MYCRHGCRKATFPSLHCTYMSITWFVPCHRVHWRHWFTAALYHNHLKSLVYRQLCLTVYISLLKMLVHSKYAWNCRYVYLPTWGRCSVINLRVSSLGVTGSQFSVRCSSRDDCPVYPILCQMLYLRSLKSLGSLGLAGNPVADSPQYKTYIGAFLPQLIYLDYRLIPDEWHRRGLQAHRSDTAAPRAVQTGRTDKTKTPPALSFYWSHKTTSFHNKCFWDSWNDFRKGLSERRSHG